MDLSNTKGQATNLNFTQKLSIAAFDMDLNQSGLQIQILIRDDSIRQLSKVHVVFAA